MSNIILGNFEFVVLSQISWLLSQRSWVRFPALPDFLISSRSGTGSTHPREDI
jgi:hypothetical protein